MLIDPTIQKYFTDEMVFAKLNAEKADSLDAQAYKIRGYPTFVLTDASGKEVDRIPGYLDAPDFLETINNYLKGIGTLDDLLAKAKDSSDRMLYAQIAEKYKYRGASDDAKVWYKKIIDEGDPKDSLSGESKIALADMTLRDKDYQGALKEFDDIEKEFDGTMFGENAMYYTAYIYRAKLNDTAKAIDAYQQIIKAYPKSEDLEYAQKKIKQLKGEAEE